MMPRYSRTIRHALDREATIEQLAAHQSALDALDRFESRVVAFMEAGLTRAEAERRAERE